MSPLGGRFHESQEFLLVYRVVNFVIVEFPRHTNHKAQHFFVVFLTEHSSHTSVRSIDVQDIRFVSVRESEYNVAEEAPLQFFEGSLLYGSPVPNLFSSQGGEWGSDSGELREELVVEATENREMSKRASRYWVPANPKSSDVSRVPLGFPCVPR